MQQDASNKLGMAPKTCMSVAQKLYEAGKITYMRTDSVELSSEALTMCKKHIADVVEDVVKRNNQFIQIFIKIFIKIIWIYYNTF
jgi:DNA topoisomerase I